MSFFDGINFWIATILLLIPAIYLGINEKKNNLYILVISLFFVISIYSKKVFPLLYLIIFVIYQFYLIKLFINWKNSKNVYIFVLLNLAPLLFSRVFNLFGFRVGFIGISYITFKAIQVIIEINDGLIKGVKFIDYISFMLFFPTIFSGPIDRSRRFLSDVYSIRSKKDYLEMLGEGIEFILQGLFYKMILAQLLFDRLVPFSERYAPIYLILYMYIYGFYLFFDFAGYSLMAVGVSKILGINTPMNFNKPFIAKDIKDFWNRWHISLSHWFRDFVFSRIILKLFKVKVFNGNSFKIAYFAYIVNMFLMGIWHGFSFDYVLYGIYHGILLSATERFQKTVFYRKHKKEKWFEYASIFVTFNLVMFGFFIFSGKFVKVLAVIGEKLC